MGAFENKFVQKIWAQPGPLQHLEPLVGPTFMCDVIEVGLVLKKNCMTLSLMSASSVVRFVVVRGGGGGGGGYSLN